MAVLPAAVSRFLVDVPPGRTRGAPPLVGRFARIAIGDSYLTARPGRNRAVFHRKRPRDTGSRTPGPSEPPGDEVSVTRRTVGTAYALHSRTSRGGIPNCAQGPHRE